MGETNNEDKSVTPKTDPKWQYFGWPHFIKTKLKLPQDPISIENENYFRELGMSSLKALAHLIGIPQEKWDVFTECGQENDLLMNRCMYEYYNMLSDFQTNYANELAQCKQKWAVLCYAEEQKAVMEENSEQSK